MENNEVIVIDGTVENEVLSLNTDVEYINE